MNEENNPITFKRLMIFFTMLGFIGSFLFSIVKVYDYVESIKEEANEAEIRVIMNDINHIKVSLDKTNEKMDILLGQYGNITTTVELIKLDNSMTKDRLLVLESK